MPNRKSILYAVDTCTGANERKTRQKEQENSSREQDTRSEERGMERSKEKKEKIKPIETATVEKCKGYHSPYKKGEFLEYLQTGISLRNFHL